MNAMQLGAEVVPVGEEAAIEQIRHSLLARYNKNNPPGSKLAHRAFHVKSHGLVKAEFSVRNDLPETLQYGAFKRGKTYSAWLRFSNGFPTTRADSSPDIRAVAIKLVGVDAPGSETKTQTQDFILANHPGFFVKNAEHFAALLANPALFALGFAPLGLRWREAKNLLGCMFSTTNTPLGIQYWSQTPSKLRNGAVKYSLRPTSASLDNIDVQVGPNKLRAAMAAYLQHNDATFDFMVQPQIDAVSMPIEDATVIWSEELSPLQKIATIRIPAQKFDTPERDAMGEHLSFSPWHTIEDHRPLGGINRVRRVMYEMIAALRHSRNGVPMYEPIE